MVHGSRYYEQAKLRDKVLLPHQWMVLFLVAKLVVTLHMKGQVHGGINLRRNWCRSYEIGCIKLACSRDPYIIIYFSRSHY